MARTPALPAKAEQALDVIRGLEAAEPAAEHTEVLSAALRHRSSHVVARAARLVGERRLHTLEAPLKVALQRFYDKGGEADPGCSAKLALAEALDLLETLDAGPFEVGIRLRQPEASWGPPKDSAKGLRARCGYALARLWGSEALPLLADLLADSEAAVRREATRAIAHAGGVGAVALLRFKLRTGDPDPEEGPDVLGEAVLSLAALDGEAVLAVAADLLQPAPGRLGRRGERASSAEVAVGVALGETRLPGALAILGRWYKGLDATRDQEAAITAIAVLRTDGARDWLLDRLATEASPLAQAAARSLAIYRFQEGTETAARRAASRNRHVDLEPVLDEVFAE